MSAGIRCSVKNRTRLCDGSEMRLNNSSSACAGYPLAAVVLWCLYIACPVLTQADVECLKTVTCDDNVSRNGQSSCFKGIAEVRRHHVIGTDNGIRLFSFAGEDLRSKPCGTVLPLIAVNDVRFCMKQLCRFHKPCNTFLRIRIALESGKAQESAAMMLPDQVRRHVIERPFLRDLYGIESVGSIACVDAGDVCLVDPICDALFQSRFLE